MTSRRGLTLAAALAGIVLVGLGGCAYYNTFYLAKRYYARSLNDVPYPLDKTDLSPQPQFANAITLSKKLIAQYPKSKWVDDAYVLWAKSLIANDDPREALRMLEEYPALYPKGSARSEATFYLGVAYLRARKYERALETLDRFDASSPRKELEPYALLERSRALLALDRASEAADAAGLLLERFPRSALVTRARLARAQALLTQKEYDRARSDYRYLGQRALSDDDRLTYLLNESDCLEGAQKFDEALGLLQDALAHEREPTRADTTGGRFVSGPGDAASQRYGQLLLRIGTVHLSAGRLNEALAAYTRVLQDYPHTTLGGEAQFRIAYAYETAGDDFDRARTEYGRVREQGAGATFADQATARLTSLDQLAAFRKGGGDTLSRAADGEFLLAEQYLFQLDRPERALEEYQRIAQRFAGSPFEPKAINAQAWVLSRKLKRPTEADSLFWLVVREHPGTEAQLAARDYLEAEGFEVPQDLIRLPEPTPTAADSAAAAAAAADTVVLTQPPAGPIPLGMVGTPSADSLHLNPGGAGLSLPPITVPGDSTHVAAPGAPGSDSTHTAAPAPADTTHVAAPIAPAPRDTTKTPAVPADTSHARAPAPAPTPAPTPAPPPVPRDTTGALD